MHPNNLLQCRRVELQVHRASSMVCWTSNRPHFSHPSLPVHELPDDAPAGDASASTGARTATPRNEEMASLFEEIELEDMIDVDEQSATEQSTTTSGGGGAPR